MVPYGRTRETACAATCTSTAKWNPLYGRNEEGAIKVRGYKEDDENEWSKACCLDSAVYRRTDLLIALEVLFNSALIAHRFGKLEEAKIEGKERRVSQVLRSVSAML